MNFMLFVQVVVLASLVGLISSTDLNVLGTQLELCSDSPLTGFRRNGLCETDENDQGLHLVCAQMNQAFLDYTRAQGNDLTTPSRHFPGLREGDYWCLCVFRWYEAYRAGSAPPLVLAATHARTLDHLRQFNVGLNNLSESQALGTRPLHHQNGFNSHHDSDL